MLYYSSTTPVSKNIILEDLMFQISHFEKLKGHQFFKVYSYLLDISIKGSIESINEEKE